MKKFTNMVDKFFDWSAKLKYYSISSYLYYLPVQAETIQHTPSFKFYQWLQLLISLSTQIWFNSNNSINILQDIFMSTPILIHVASKFQVKTQISLNW